MALYTFYMCNSDGGSNALEVFDLASDINAEIFAQRMLREHPSCAYVAIFEKDRAVATRHRDPAEAAARTSGHRQHAG
jgi:hypothetical protein